MSEVGLIEERQWTRGGKQASRVGLVGGSTDWQARSGQGGGQVGLVGGAGRLGVAGEQAEQASLEAQQAGGQKVVAREDKWALLEVQQVE